jgi:signal transduction histidine kinase
VSSPVQRAPEEAPRSGRLRSAGEVLGHWRNLRLPVKLSLVMLVPMIVMVTLGVVLISGQVANSDQYAHANRITELSATIRDSITALQDERLRVATPGRSSAAIDTARSEVNSALDTTRRTVATDSADGDLDPVASEAWATADRQLAELQFLREETGAPVPDPSAEVSAYTQLVDGLFAFDRVLTTALADPQLTREALSLYDLFAAREEVRYQQSVVLVGIAKSTMSVDDVTSLHGSEARLASRISDFRAVASEDVTQRYAHTVSGPALATQSSLLGKAIDQSGGMSGQVMPGMTIQIPVPTWNAATRTVTTGLTSVTDELGSELQSGATSLRTSADNAAATATAALVIALAAAIALMVVIARQLLRSIGLLRRTARDVATRRLPEAVERIRAGETVDADIEPVGVRTTDEVGQLARAFDAVHAEALRLAVEQANLRANYSELFVNLSRRSQSLVQRQLRLIEQLERDEEDPDQLAALFKLDHLATRMRRNNENLMVLSGNELTRGPSQPVSLADLLRAAVSEIEHYKRVVVQPPPDTHVVGYAAGDLVRLLAELLDNATAFSAPDTPVTVASHRTRRQAVVIDIVDHGIGMGDEELVKANEHLSQPAGVEGRMSRRMGLFVISRLANEHGVRVRLHGGQDIPGLRVTITVPVELVIGESGPVQATTPLTDGRNNGGPHSGGAHSGGPQGSVSQGSGPLSGGPRRGQHGGGFNGGGTGEFGGPLPKRAVRPSGGAHVASGIAAAGLGAGSTGGTDPTGPIGAGPVGSAGGVATGLTNGTVGGVTSGTLGGRGGAADPVASAMTVTIPALPSAASSGVGLFAPLPADDQDVAEPAAGGGEAARGRQPDVTPIYDTMVSAWFDASAVLDDPVTAPVDGTVTRTANGAAGWRFAADAGWQAVDAVADAQPAEFTTAGLPKRQPKALLLPGSAHGRHQSTETRTVGVPAEHLRDRLAGFQRGVRRGRQLTGVAGSSGSPEVIEGEVFGSEAFGTEAFGRGALPVDRADLQPQSELPAPSELQPPAEPPAAVVTDVVEGTPDTVVPDVSTQAEESSVATAADTAAADVTDVAAVEPRAVDTGQPEPDQADETSPVAPNVRTWSSSADEGWRAADAVNSAAPDDFTSVGLPKRQPKAQLLPGSVAVQGNPAVNGRDADALRDRLNSFQRGVRQGRGGTATEGTDRVEHGFHW